jgi:hypothetical protein
MQSVSQIQGNATVLFLEQTKVIFLEIHRNIFTLSHWKQSYPLFQKGF